MAKLADLKTLLEQAPRRPAPAPVAPVAPVAPAAALAPVASPRRAVAAGKHADGDVDLARAFADVTKMAPPNRANSVKARPAPVARQRIADEREALILSKYGSEPAPQTWEIGQEIEGEQTFLRRGLGTDVLTGLRRGRWVVQADLDEPGSLGALDHAAVEGAAEEVGEDGEDVKDHLIESRKFGWESPKLV